MILSDDDLNFTFDEIQRELTNLGIVGLNNQQLIHLKNDLDLLINKEKYALHHFNHNQHHHQQQPSQSLTTNDNSMNDNDTYQQIDGNNHITTDNSKGIVSYLSKSPVVSSSPPPSSSSSSCFSVTSEDFTYYNTISHNCNSVNNQLKKFNDHTILNDSIKCKSSITNNYPLNLNGRNISNDSSVSNVVQLSPKHHDEHDHCVHQKPYSSTDSQITACFSTTNEAMNNLDTTSISSSLSSTTLLLNEPESHFEEKQQKVNHHHHHHQRQQQKQIVQSGNEMTSSKQSVNFKYSDANGQPIHSKSSMKNPDFEHRLNNEFKLTPMRMKTSSSTDKNYCHSKSVPKDSSSQLRRSSACLQHQHQQARDSHQHLHYDQESQDKLYGKRESIIEKVTTHTTTNADQHDVRSNKLLVSNNKLEKILGYNEIDDALSSINYERQKSTTTTTNSSRRSARFLDNPVEQVHSVPQQRRPKSAQHCQKGNDFYCYNARSLHSQNLQRPVSTITQRQKQDPVTKYHSYQRSWSIHSTPGENARRVLRWNIRTAMMHREIPLLQRNSSEVIRLLGPYASAYLEQERQRRIKALQVCLIILLLSNEAI
ncbi:unnamed protein product [Schistosoma margrebowiei]|uniref:Uncharacterized protein n=1 Tax=Schistosoma margrebowiei TaxID=48269 RepID=A0A183MM43_9TREM|nr:unnamed protein product [Schistosoma margrebowiei]